MPNTYGRQVVLALVNGSGGSVVAGDVVIIDTSADGSFTTTTTGQAEVSVGIAQETIAAAATGRVLVAGYAALVNVPSSQTRGRFLETHTVVKQAVANATRRAGSFGQLVTGGTTPAGWLWGSTDQTAGTPADILDLPTAEMDDSLVLAPDGAGGVEFRAEAGGGALAFAQATITSETTVTGGTLTDITGATVTLTTGARRCRVSFLCHARAQTTGVASLTVVIDGTPLDADAVAAAQTPSAVGVTLGGTLLTAVLSAGSHTIKLQGHRLVSAGDVYFGSATILGYLLVEETAYTT